MVKLRKTLYPKGNEGSFPFWYCAKTGIYSSKHPTITLPDNPFLDVVSFIFTHKNSGVLALVDSITGISISYSELYPMVKSIASGLHQRGVSQGDVVLILLPNSIYFPVILLGVLSLGATVTTMNPFSSLLEIKKQALDCGITLAFTTNDKVAKLFTLGVPVIRVPEILVSSDNFSESSDFNELISSDPNWDSRVSKIQQQFCIHRKNRSQFVVQGYGMAESTAIATRGYNTEKLHNYSSVGLLAPNMQAKVVDWITGSPLPPNYMGELWLSGPGVMKVPNFFNVTDAIYLKILKCCLSSKRILYLALHLPGYLNNLEATKSTVDGNGWLHTGDIAYFDEEGYLYVIDRLKEIIKYKGFQIAPAYLEVVLVSHPDIIDAAVTGCICRQESCALSQTDVIDFVSKQVDPYKKIRKVYFRASIPRSAAGKILRKELKNLLTSKLYCLFINCSALELPNKARRTGEI
ncbi:hypothetical protein K7X08_020891 [Anisodus acutangulus]|uniref:4-coumarate--CoA ligase n=1 Tax=Anisodus acutangulus TaxID=402998 RepID=A0A9Q1RQX0_9SOLA|nr:hypothetical protein K7X08_020891 [Anisodus acutangulus]